MLYLFTMREHGFYTQYLNAFLAQLLIAILVKMIL